MSLQELVLQDAIFDRSRAMTLGQAYLEALEAAHLNPCIKYHQTGTVLRFRVSGKFLLWLVIQRLLPVRK